MADGTEPGLPRWAPRLRKSLIAQFYRTCGQGIIDHELVDQVGYALYARCKSILEATEAGRGRVPCPNCGSVVHHTPWEHEVLRCLNCGWECAWQKYQKTFQRKHLFAGGMEPFLREFVDKFPKARSHSERLILIDTLIHRYHWENSGGGSVGRPGASSLIEGKLKNIVPFLDNLSYGDQVPQEVEATRERWRETWRRSKWYRPEG